MIEFYKAKKNPNSQLVDLGPDFLPPDLVLRVSSSKTPGGKIKKNKYLIKIEHPNTSEILEEREISALSVGEAFSEAKKYKTKLVKVWKTWHEPKKTKKAGRKGKFSLTKKETKKKLVNKTTAPVDNKKNIETKNENKEKIRLYPDPSKGLTKEMKDFLNSKMELFSGDLEKTVSHLDLLGFYE